MKKNMRNLFVALLGAFFMFGIQGNGIAEQPAETKKAAVYLSALKTLPESSAYVRDKDVEGNSLMLNGVEFKKGLCVNTNSELIYRINGKYSVFKAVVGPADAYMEYKGRLIFSVYGDGKKLYESKPLAIKEKEEISIKVEEVQHLALRVNDDGPHSQFAVWADAALY